VTLHELFETEYADRFGMLPSEVKAARLGPDSYNSLSLARCFRFFCAGFEANDGGKMRVIGYMSKKGVQEAGVSAAVQISQIPTKSRTIEVFVKDGEFSKEESQA
jgi:hypothetical protein